MPGGPENRVHCVWLSTSSQCLNQFAWFLTDYIAVLLGTHLLTFCWSNVQHKVAPPRDKVNNPVFADSAFDFPQSNIFKVNASFCIIFGTLQCRVVLDVCWLHFHQLFYTKCRPLLKDNSSFPLFIKKQTPAFFSLLAFWLQSKDYEKSTALFLFRMCLMCLPFYCKTHSS